MLACLFPIALAISCGKNSELYWRSENRELEMPDKSRPHGPEFHSAPPRLWVVRRGCGQKSKAETWERGGPGPGNVGSAPPLLLLPPSQHGGRARFAPVM